VGPLWGFCRWSVASGFRPPLTFDQTIISKRNSSFLFAAEALFVVARSLSNGALELSDLGGGVCTRETSNRVISGEMTNSSSDAIVTRNISRHYKLGTTVIRAVDEVSVDIKKGEFVALLGASGSGKSTLLNLFAGLDRSTAGSIEVLGHNLAQASSEELSRFRRLTVGMIFQSFNLIPSMTVFENIELPLRFAETERNKRESLVFAAIERVELSHRSRHRPGELSGGEQQRVSIARALINNPSILLADEPTGNLDSRTGSEIMNVIRRCNDELKMTIVMVTHERSIADRVAQYTIFMQDGKITLQEPKG